MTTNCTGFSTLTLTGISRKKCTAVSLRPTGRPAGMHKALKRTYSCNICGKRYSQQQNVLRHQRKAHSNPHPCIVTGCGFKWTRPYVYRKHLKCHSDCVNPEEALGKPAGSRHRSNIIGRDLPPPVIYPDQRRQAESRQHSMTQPLPAAANVTYAPLSAMSLVEVVVYDLPPEHAEPAIITCKHEDACRLEFIGAINSPSVFSECAQPVNDLSIHGGQTWLVHAFLCATCVISDPQIIFSGCSQPTQEDALQPTAHPTQWRYISPHPSLLPLDIIATRSMRILWLGHLCLRILINSPLRIRANPFAP